MGNISKVQADFQLHATGILPTKNVKVELFNVEDVPLEHICELKFPSL